MFSTCLINTAFDSMIYEKASVVPIGISADAMPQDGMSRWLRSNIYLIPQLSTKVLLPLPGIQGMLAVSVIYDGNHGEFLQVIHLSCELSLENGLFGSLLRSTRTRHCRALVRVSDDRKHLFSSGIDNSHVSWPRH